MFVYRKKQLVSIILLMMIVGGLVAVLIVVGREVAYQNRVDLINELSVASNLRALDLASEDYVMGDRDSKVIVVEYSDLECPYCKQFHERRSYFQDRFKDQDVAFVFRHFPLEYLHTQALEEAVALECAGMLAGEGAFFMFRDMVYAHTEGDDTLDLNLLPQFARRVGIEEEDFASCRAGTEGIGRVREDMVRGALDGVSSTPTLVLYKDGKLQFAVKGGSAIGWRNLELGIEALLQK